MSDAYETDSYEMEGYNRNNNNGHFWGNVAAGVLIGVVVGGGLALLFAPKSGPDTRADLEGAVGDLKSKAEQTLDELQGSASGLVTRSKNVLDQTRENIVRSVEAGKEAYVQKKEELSAQLDAHIETQTPVAVTE